MTDDPPMETLPATLTADGRGLGPGLLRRLLVLFAPNPAAIGRVTSLDLDVCELGRSCLLCEILQLRDGRQSRRHARISQAGERVTLDDLSSRNGTFVDGRRVESAPLRDGAVIRVGDSVLLFEEIETGPTLRLAPESAPLWGPSVGLQRVRGEIELVGPRDVPVLVLGETGAGKELVAEALHEASGRSGAFVPVNCGALPADLVESELFGHTEGAFTGAGRASRGLFVAADGGTLFLDEIGELPLEQQTKLLRALSTGEIRQVGGTRTRTVNVRPVAATNRDLRERVEAEAFRGDLYARLAAWELEVPPLRRRRADILAIAGRAVDGMPPLHADAAEALLLNDWPYNVRGLLQTLSAAVVRAQGAQRLELAHLPERIRAPIDARSEGLVSTSRSEAPLELLVRREGTPSQADLERVMAHHRGNVAQVAAFFGKERAQVYRWVRRYGLDPEAYRKE